MWNFVTAICKLKVDQSGFKAEQKRVIRRYEKWAREKLKWGCRVTRQMSFSYFSSNQIVVDQFVDHNFFMG